MEVVYERCAGLDVHKRTVTACIITPEERKTRTFGAMTKDLLGLVDWLMERRVSHVAMESTGVYWKPVWNLLEGSFALVLANAQHIKAVPGRKTDVKDAEWIADLLRHGLVRGSYIPDRAQRELRELTRYRVSLVQERSAEVNRLQKVLEGANVKLAAVATDIAGKSGRAMLHALLEGVQDPALLANLAKGRLRSKIPLLQHALTGRFGPHQRFLVAQQLAHIDYLDEAIAEVETHIEEEMRPFEAAIEQLVSIPGVKRTVAQVLVAELGTDMSQFPTAAHAASWAKLSPGNRESAGKRLSSWTGKGNRWLRRVLLQAAHAAAREQQSYLAAQYRRLAPRRGRKRAAVAVAHSILTIAYHLLERQCTYEELGANYFDERQREATIRRAVHRIERLGYRVTLETAA